jgi:hypothetical protein
MSRSKYSPVLRKNFPCFSGGVCLSRRAAIIGVSVSETTAEMRIATARVTANSRKRRPTTSPMKSSGISTATSENVSEMMVKAICCEPISAASMRSLPSST